MKIVILANRDLASNLAINHLLTPLSEHDISIMLSSRVGGARSKAPRALKDLRFFEQTLFNDIVFPLISTMPKAGATRPLSFDDIEKEIGTTIETLSEVKSEAAIEKLRACDADVFISIRFGLILHDELIALPRLGVLNLHSGILPDYKGVMATFWAMKNREATIGTTLHFIQDNGIDSGDVIAVNTRPVDYERSYLWNVLGLYEAGCRDLVEAIEILADGATLKRDGQGPGGEYYSFPSDDDIDVFFQDGGSLFDGEEIVEVFRQFVS